MGARAEATLSLSVSSVPTLHRKCFTFLHRHTNGNFNFISSYYICMTSLSPLVAAEGAQPVATVAPSVLNVPQGQRAEFRCTVTGNPTPAVEWIGMTPLVYSVSSVPQNPVFILHLKLVYDSYRRSRKQNESQSCDTRRRADLHSCRFS